MTSLFLTTLLSLILSFPAASYSIYGTVCDAADGAPIVAADVIVTDMDDKVLAHGTSDSQGRFAVKDISKEEVLVLVKMMGYDTFVSERLRLDTSKPYDLGVVKLDRSAVGLQEATVTGEKNRIVYKLDRQQISSSSSVTASGGTAVDILSGLPSVLVDSDGNLSFRGSTRFLVYVDGKPSPLEGTSALQQIPAASVEDIEIITTPSARYKTDGDAGIINITTRKSLSDQWSGLLTVTGSTLGTWGFDGTLNYRNGRNNWYAGGTLQEIKGRSDFKQEKNTEVLGIETTSLSEGDRWSRNGTYVGRAGWQYSDGRRHNLSLDAQAGKTDYWRGGDMRYDETRVYAAEGGREKALYDSHDRYNLMKKLFQVSLDYVWRPNEKNEIALQNRFRYDGYSIEYTESNMFDLSGNRYEGTRGYEEEHHWDCDGSLTYKLNYREGGDLEAGYQYTTYSEHGSYRIKYWDRDAGEFDWQEDLATPFYYRRQVHSLYAMVVERVGRLTFDAGVRGDRVLDLMDIEIVDASRDIKRFDLFPSAHFQYDAGGAGTFRAGYSYRTNRPGIWNLEPYITYEDYYTKKIGNPDILPEYAHSGEVGWNKSFSKGNSLSTTVYYRYRKDISDWIRTAYEPGVTLDQIVNAGNQAEAGLELAGVWHPARWWTSSAAGSVFDYRFTSRNAACSDAEGFYYQANWINTFQASKSTRLQFDAYAVGPKILTQGREKAYAYFNLGIRKQALKDLLTISMVAHDVFHTARYFNTREAPGLLSRTTVRPKYPNIVVSLTWNFNSSSQKTPSASGPNLFEGKDF
ncbi:MAG: TonB-dependent receptor [Bacteroidales bacterium]|nr:TonB-dependent receptor [Bacteroidales bacterium]